MAVEDIESKIFRRGLGLLPHAAELRELCWSRRSVVQLSPQHVLKGHQGCVNRMSWSATGSHLLSGSDDKQLILWDCQDVSHAPLSINTQHHANIFGVAFLASSTNSKLVSGSMDHSVQLHTLDSSSSSTATGGGSTSGSPYQPALPRRRQAMQPRTLRTVTPHTVVYHCHTSRVKDVKTEAGSPHMFWSAGEDGCVRQYDTRVSGQTQPESANVLIQPGTNPPIEVKGLDISKTQPHLMALACGDPYVRLYDRRKLAPRTLATQATPAMLELAPPHVATRRRETFSRTHATCVNFSGRSDKIVASYHGDQGYSFDVTSSGAHCATYLVNGCTVPSYVPEGAYTTSSQEMGSSLCNNGCGRSSSGGGMGDSIDSRNSSPRLPSRADEARQSANAALFNKHFSKAVELYSSALHLAPNNAALLAARASALLQRGWVGDAAWALRDCDTAIELDDGCAKAFLVRISALKDLGQLKTASCLAEQFRALFPDRAIEELARLQLSLSEARAKRREERQQSQQHRERVRRSQQSAANQRPDRDSAVAPDPVSASLPASAAPAAVPAATPDVTLRTAHPETSAAAAAVGHTTADEIPGTPPLPDNRTRTAAVAGGTEPAATVAGVTGGHTPDIVLAVVRNNEDGESAAVLLLGAGASLADTAYGAPAVPAPQASMPQPATMLRVQSAAAADTAAGVTAEAQVQVAPIRTTSQPADPLVLSAAATASADTVRHDTVGGGAGTAAGLSGAGTGSEEASDDSDTSDVEEQLMLDCYCASPLTTKGSITSTTSASLVEGAAGRGLWAATQGGRRMLARYCGHCNLQTDIKEACFLGTAGSLVACGSDDGRVYFFDAESGRCLHAVQADEDVANCVQPHPYLPLLATSGIESVIRLWSPSSDPAPMDAGSMEQLIEHNEERLREGASPVSRRTHLAANPRLLQMLVNQLYGRGTATATAGNGGEDGTDEAEGEDEAETPGRVTCRVN